MTVFFHSSTRPRTCPPHPPILEPPNGYQSSSHIIPQPNTKEKNTTPPSPHHPSSPPSTPTPQPPPPSPLPHLSLPASRATTPNRASRLPPTPEPPPQRNILIVIILKEASGILCRPISTNSRPTIPPQQTPERSPRTRRRSHDGGSDSVVGPAGEQEVRGCTGRFGRGVGSGAAGGSRGRG